MSFPSPTLAAPILLPYQMQFNGLVIGGVAHGTAYQMIELDGINTPDYLAGDVQRALDQGEWNGLDLSPGRDVTLKQVIQADVYSLDHARQQLAGVLAVAGSTDEPLYLQLPSGVYACMSRPRKHAGPLDKDTLIAGAPTATTMWHATDPRWYLMPTKTATVGLPEPSGGVSFPISFPVSFGGGSPGGRIEALNVGNFEMRPVLVVTGPCTNPRISNLSIASTPTIGFNLKLNAGDTLTIDTDGESAVLVTAGSSEGASRRSSEMPGSVWWNLPPGSNLLEFTTEDKEPVAGTLTVQWADAFIGL